MALATLDEYQTLLQVELDPIAGAAVDNALEAVSAAVRNITAQNLELVADDEITVNGPGGCLLMLPEKPLVDLTAVTMDDEDVLADVKLYDASASLLYLACGWRRGVQNITVTYSHGYDPLPEDVKSAVILAAKNLIQNSAQQAGVQSETVGPFSVTYTATSADVSASLEPFRFSLAPYHAPRIPIA